MKIQGTIKDASKEKPIAGAKVVLQVGDKELSVIYSNKNGEFEHSEAADYVGKVLICDVQKEGFKSQEVTYHIEQEEMQLNIELISEKEEGSELSIRVTDEQKKPLEQVKVTLEYDGKQIGIGISDKNGIIKIKLSPDLEGRKITFKAELGGFEVTSGEIGLEKETSAEVIMKKSAVVPPAPPDKKWMIIAGAVAAIVILIIVVMSIKPGPQEKTPSIVQFKAQPDTVKPGGSSTLMWKTKNAGKVLLNNKSVGANGSKKVKVTKTAKYALAVFDKNNKERNKQTIQIVAVKDTQKDKKALCDNYANAAITHQKINLIRKCGFKGARWQSNYNNHFKWCMGRSDAGIATSIENKTRRADLAKCERKGIKLNKKDLTIINKHMQDLKRFKFPLK